jgi:hypothetical protein
MARMVCGCMVNTYIDPKLMDNREIYGTRAVWLYNIGADIVRKSARGRVDFLTEKVVCGRRFIFNIL